MKVSVVTTFSPKGYEVYGRRMIQTFADYWPVNVDLYACFEGQRPADASPRAKWVALDSDPNRAAFIEEHADKDKPEDFRFRPVRYSHKVWAMTGAPRDCDYLMWLDGDTETQNPVTAEVVHKLVPAAGKVASYLGRPYHRHSETGFLAFSMKDGGAEMLDEMRRIYTSGEIFKLPEWHDCMVFDHVRVKFERRGMRFHNLCPAAVGLNVFEQSPLATIIRHNKGPERKERVYGDPMLVG